MMRYGLNVEDKKVLVNRLGELTGIKPKYTFMPRCAYEIGAYTVERRGDLVVEEEDADEAIIRTLMEEGLITDGSHEDADAADGITVSDPEYEQEAEEESAVSLGIRDAEEPTVEPVVEPEDETVDETEDESPEKTGEASAGETVEETAEEPAAQETMQENMEDETAEVPAAPEDAGGFEEPDSLTISLPMNGHTADSLRRMVNLLYSRGRLLSKATGGRFGVEKELVEALDDAGTIVRAEDFISIVKEHGGMTGLAFEDGKVSFTGFPLTDDPDRNKAFQQIACLMNRHALEMKRIQAKEVNDANEKYAFRIWLLRIGMNTDEYKTARRVLMENLSGHTAFRTKAEEEKWKANQKAKRDALRAAKAAADGADTAETGDGDDVAEA